MAFWLQKTGKDDPAVWSLGKSPCFFSLFFFFSPHCFALRVIPIAQNYSVACVANTARETVNFYQKERVEAIEMWQMMERKEMEKSVP